MSQSPLILISRQKEKAPEQRAGVAECNRLTLASRNEFTFRYEWNDPYKMTFGFSILPFKFFKIFFFSFASLRDFLFSFFFSRGILPPPWKASNHKSPRDKSLAHAPTSVVARPESSLSSSRISLQGHELERRATRVYPHNRPPPRSSLTTGRETFRVKKHIFAF